MLIQPGSLSEQTIQMALSSSSSDHILVGLRACSSIHQVPPETIRRILLHGMSGTVSEALFTLCLSDRDELLKFIYPPEMGGYAQLSSGGEHPRFFHRLRAAQIYRTKWPCDPDATNALLASSSNSNFLVGCALAQAQTTPDLNLLVDRLHSPRFHTALAATGALLSREDLVSEHPDVAQQVFTKRGNVDWILLHQQTLDLCRTYQHPSNEIVRKWLQDPQWYLRMAAMASCCNCPDISADILECGACDPNSTVREEAARAMAGRNDISSKLIEQLLNDPSRDVRLIMAESCLNNQSIPTATLRRWQQSYTPVLQAAALHAYAQRPKTSLRQFVKGLESPSIIVQTAALKALLSRRQVVPSEKESLSPRVLLPLLRSDDAVYGKTVRDLAQAVLHAYNVQLPVMQDDPLLSDRIVYKMCMNNVIVIARIPPDAQVLWTETPGRLRANKAEIVGIDICFYNDRVGISTYDHRTIYRIGDMVEVPNFDMRSGVNSTGFYFVCSLRELY